MATDNKNSLRKRLRYLLEFCGICLLLGLFRLMPIDLASGIGGRIGGMIGPRLAASRKATANLKLALPELSHDERRRILKGMWANLGRVAAELPHMPRISPLRVEIVGREHIQPYLDDHTPVIFFTGHLGNWEISPGAMAAAQAPVAVVYRRPNNPFVAALLERFRLKCGAAGQLAKGREGAHQMLKTLRQGRHLGVLIDQKLNEGMPIPFFGHKAMTAPGIVQIALKLNCPLVPSRIERLEGANFRLTFYPALEIPDNTDKDERVKYGLEQINNHLESWIRERPEQWLWLHRRWPPQDKKDNKSGIHISPEQRK